MKKKILYTSLFFALLCFGSQSWADDEKYRIGPGDVLEISVWKDDSLYREVVVPPDGVIAFPLVGDIDVNDITVSRLRKAITEMLFDYVPDATVTVIIKEINSLNAYVIGKVNNPGKFPITMNTTVVQILAMAQGLNPFASESNIQILRRKKNHDVQIPFNFKQVKRGINLKQNIILQSGDVVVVP